MRHSAKPYLPRRNRGTKRTLEGRTVSIRYFRPASQLGGTKSRPSRLEHDTRVLHLSRRKLQTRPVHPDVSISSASRLKSKQFPNRPNHLGLMMNTPSVMCYVAFPAP